jgi:predicted SnoaL-like aldol condensation-catalyzing enzyme
MSEANTAANKALAIEAITGVFIKRDTTIPGKLFVTDYKQHNPTIPNGNASIPDVSRSTNESERGKFVRTRQEHGKTNA